MTTPPTEPGWLSRLLNAVVDGVFSGMTELVVVVIVGVGLVVLKFWRWPIWGYIFGRRKEPTPAPAARPAPPPPAAAPPNPPALSAQNRT